MNIKDTYPEVYAIIDLLILYPPGFFLSWGPNLIMSVAFNFAAIHRNPTNIQIFNAITILATQSGTIVTIIFFMKSKEARYRWHQKLSSLFNLQTSPNSNDIVRDSDAPVDFQDEENYGRRLEASQSVISPATSDDQKKSTISFLHEHIQSPSSGSASSSRHHSEVTSSSSPAVSSSPRSLSTSYRVNSTAQRSVFSDEDDPTHMPSTDVENDGGVWPSYGFRMNSNYDAY